MSGKKHLKPLEKRNLLGNFTAYDMDGEFLFNCDSKKASWYTRKNLATWMNEEKTHFKLNFKPKGNGNRDLGKYFTVYISNQCVICGCSDDLTKHHVVPSCYRCHFPPMCKSNDHFDVLLVCIECHERTEESYNDAKKRLNKPYKGEIEHVYNSHKQLNSLIRTAQKHEELLDDTRKQQMVDTAISINPVLDTFDKLKSFELVDIGGSMDNDICSKVVRDNQDDLKNFIIFWRELFLEYSQPMFLPSGWLSDYKNHFKF